MAIPTGKVVKMELSNGEALVDGLIERWGRFHRERGLRPFERDRSAHLNKAEQGGLVFHLKSQAVPQGRLTLARTIISVSTMLATWP